MRIEKNGNVNYQQNESKKIVQQKWSQRMQGTFGFFTFSSIVQIDPFCNVYSKKETKLMNSRRIRLMVDSH